MASQWFPFYWGDYKRDTSSLSLAEHGAYLHMLGELYVSKAPLDPNSIYRICHAITKDEQTAVDKVLKRFMSLTDAGYVQERALKEIEKSNRLTERAKTAADVRWGPDQKKSHLTRSGRLETGRQLGRHSGKEWQALLQALGTNCLKCGAVNIVKDHIVPLYQGGSDGLENIQPLCDRCNGGKGADTTDFRPKDWETRTAKFMPEDWVPPSKRLPPHPHPHPHPHPEATPTGKTVVGRADRFQDFWSVYPKKVKKKQARDIWKRKGLDAIADKIVQDVKTRLEEDGQWLDGFIPHPTTYLTGDRWDDEISERRGRR